MNKALTIIITAAALVLFAWAWVDFMAAYEEYIGLNEELRVYTPMK